MKWLFKTRTNAYGIHSVIFQKISFILFTPFSCITNVENKLRFFFCEKGVKQGMQKELNFQIGCNYLFLRLNPLRQKFASISKTILGSSNARFFYFLIFVKVSCMQSTLTNYYKVYMICTHVVSFVYDIIISSWSL